MSTTITQSFVDAFEAYVHRLGQQQESRLFGAVRYRPIVGNTAHFERVAKSDMTAKAGRHVATPINDVVHSRRKVSMSTFSWGEAVDQNDVGRLLINPANEYSMLAAAAYGRKVDEVITAAAVGLATNGDNTTTALPAGQIIGTGVEALSLDFLRSAKRKLDEAEVGMPGSKRFLALNAKGLEDLLKVTEATSSDYNTVKALVQGELDTFMGFKFIRTELVPDPGTGHYMLAFDSSAIGLAMSQQKMTRMAEDPGLSFATRIYCETSLGAVRIEETGIVAIHIAD
jgi:hypothetical protein